MNKLAIISFFLRWILGIQFIKSGWEKGQAFSWWRDIIEKMDLFPIESTGLIAGIIPGIEVVLGVVLLAGVLQRAAAVLSSALFLGFAVVMFCLVQKDAPVLCGCFGPGSEYPVDLTHVFIDLFWFLVSLSLVFLPQRTEAGVA